MLHDKNLRYYIQIEISRVYGQNEWRDDIRKLLMKAGIIGKPLVFLFADNQVSVSTTQINSRKIQFSQLKMIP